ncbi:MAG TPA: AMP-binding protein [Syntrophales bacterium]|nr:AMP-binding protein [Syntrophales bacterium]HPC00824.1 AMP-binding protein [Syntrophales bacterium]HRS87921.1 AMP-binding protein [Syntrophales bacterium]
MECTFGLYDLIARQAALFPHREALRRNGDVFDYARLERLARSLAAGLAAAGVKTSDRVAVLSHSREEILALLVAASALGAVVVPLNVRLTAEELAYIVADCSPALICADGDHGETARSLARGLSSSFEDLHGKGDAPALAGGDASRPCLLLYTAAVSGRPRGCLLSQANLLACGFQLRDILEITGGDALVATLPLFHIGGLGAAVAALAAGARTIVMERFDPAAVVRAVADDGGTLFMTFPPMLQAVLDAQKGAGADLPSLRAVAGVDAPPTVEAFLAQNPRARFFTLYGQTEVMPVSGGDWRSRPDSVGTWAPWARVALLDDDDRPVAPGETGEICVRSPSVFLGYLGLPEETRRCGRHGWHHTGDLGRLDEEGYLYWAGRKPEKELIKTGGENVYPAEVEKVILEHPAVAEACVFGVPDERWGEAVWAACVLREGRGAGEEEIIAFVADRIARYKRPRGVTFVREIPRRPDGTPDRRKLADTIPNS